MNAIAKIVIIHVVVLFCSRASRAAASDNRFDDPAFLSESLVGFFISPISSCESPDDNAENNGSLRNENHPRVNDEPLESQLALAVCAGAS